MTYRSRRLNELTKWVLLVSFCLLTDSAQTGNSTAASKAHHAVDAEESEPHSEPPSRSLLNVTLGKNPSLDPKPSQPLVGNYGVRNPGGQVCLKANMAVQYMLTVNKKFYYFNINPSETQATGYCGNLTAVLSLEFEGGSLEFTFVKEAKEYYTRKIRALLKPVSKCKKCKSQSYPGTVDNEKLFKTTTGLCFKCKSELVVKMSSDFRLKIMASQLQPFDLAKEQFGKDFECWQDYIKRIIPIILGAIAVGVCLIATVSYLVVREYRNRGYERLS